LHVFGSTASAHPPQGFVHLPRGAEAEWLKGFRARRNRLHRIRQPNGAVRFTVLSRAPIGGDSGIDILATKAAGEQTAIWIVQCKCYGPNNPVGPDKIRELIGSIVDFRRDSPITERVVERLPEQHAGSSRLSKTPSRRGENNRSGFDAMTLLVMARRAL
jgi:hypothetical protein